jgi:aconitase A
MRLFVRVSVSDMKEDFAKCLVSPIGFKGYAVPTDRLDTKVPFQFEGREYLLQHGSVLIAAITSCTNTSNPRYSSDKISVPGTCTYRTFNELHK